MFNKLLQRDKEYVCCWCGTEFKAHARYVNGQINALDKTSKGKKQAVSSQIKCPNCLNFIPTWEKINGVKIRK